ncbi:MAG: hypothetical protein GY861_10520 [bacterium]|nr:hypothetical protein [bacterium]
MSPTKCLGRNANNEPANPHGYNKIAMNSSFKNRRLSRVDPPPPERDDGPPRFIILGCDPNGW